MRIIYDFTNNIAYIRLRRKRKNVETIRISGELNIDLAPDGTVYGIELLNATEQLKKQDKGMLLVVNEANGKRFEFALA